MIDRGFTGSRLQRLPVYAVAEIREVKQRLMSEGADLIDLGAGDADFAPPECAVEALQAALADPGMSRYSFQVGLGEYREAIARYMERRFSVSVDPVSEVLPLIGSKEGLAHLATGVLSPGDVCIYPEPGYPAYVGGAHFSDADPEVYPLRREEGFLVHLANVNPDRLARARLLYLNYPNNPTSAIAPKDYLREVVATCLTQGIALAYDNPYCEQTYDGYVAPSILEIEGAREIAVEFHSFSKSFGMTGWRLGWAVGSAELIRTLSRTKSYFDTGPFLALQKAGAAVLDSYEECVAPVRSALANRRDALVGALRARGHELEAPKATMYVWIELPEALQSGPFARDLLERDHVAVLPGSALGAGGEGYVRMALTVGAERLEQAAHRFDNALRRWGAVGANT